MAESRSAVPRVLLLTGTCGSGKSTIATMLGARPGWAHLSEDDVWARCCGKNRGAFGTSEHRTKRGFVHDVVFASIRDAVGAQRSVVLDATVHESPPESYEEYRAFFRREGIAWAVRVLHPSLEVAVLRDATRAHSLGRARVASLHEKFTAHRFPREWFLDTSSESPEETLMHLVEMGVADLASSAALQL